MIWRKPGLPDAEKPAEGVWTTLALSMTEPHLKLPQMSEQSKWEYRMVYVDDNWKLANDSLADWAAKGWELVSGSTSSWVTGGFDGHYQVTHTRFTMFWRRPVKSA